MAYATPAELRAYMDFPAGDTASDVDLQRALDAGAAWIDWGTGRTFGLSPTNTIRVYAAATTTVVPVVDLRSTAPTIAVDTSGERDFTTTLDPAQYVLNPVSGPPFQELAAWPNPAGSVDPFAFTVGQQVRITGQWGAVDATGLVPANVSQANLLLGARWFKRREAPFSVLQAASLDAFTQVTPSDVDVLQLLLPWALPGSPVTQTAAARELAPVGAAGLWVLV